MDFYDRATQQEEHDREMAIQEQAKRLPRGPSAEVCNCGIDIPEQRRVAMPGVQNCIDCQTRIERKERFRR